MSAINKILIIDDKLSQNEKDKRVESYITAINVFIDRINNDFTARSILNETILEQKIF